jgi:outer membrane protein TolC
MNKVILIVLILTFEKTYASTPRLQEVVESSKVHYPLIVQAKDSVSNAESTYQQSQGAFDMKLKGNNYWVTTGYYKRRLNEIILAKPLGVLGSSVYTSYGKAYPNFFPPQFSTLSTNSGGQAMVGGEVSLIKNSLLDEPRAKIKISEYGIGQAKQDMEWTKLQVVKESSLTYWNWLLHTKLFYIYENLLAMAQKRDEILEQRVKKGDTSEIIKKENLQYLSRRKVELANALMGLKKASIDLSLYYRNQNGELIIPDSFQLEELNNYLQQEEDIVIKELAQQNSQEIASKIVDLRPDFIKLKYEIEKNHIEYKLGQNELMPMLNIGADYTRYMGNEEPTNAAHIMQLNLKFEIPMEWDLGEGRKQAAGAQGRVLSSQLNFMKNSIQNDLLKFQESLRLSQEKVKSARQEVQYARDLLSAENIRFKNGNSNLFLVNLREENLSTAESNEISSVVELLQIFSEYKAATLQM